ncbi:MAG: glycosyltransferase [Bacteroidetes bacterium]|nr:glycosyltransferase [Bacteroidota bacterium]
MISIVTPSYNQGDFIEQTILSVLTQDCNDVEYVVIDGGSTDPTLDILRKYKGRLQWISEKDNGQTDAVNKGFRIAKGDILGWVNADDLLAPGVLSEVSELFAQDPLLMLVYGDTDNIDDKGNFLYKYPCEEFNLERLPYTCFISQPAAFFRRTLIEAVGYLDADLQNSMDLDLWIRLGFLQKQHPDWKYRYVKHLWAYNRFHPAAKSLRIRETHLRTTAAIIKKYFGFIPFAWIYGIEEMSDPRYDGIIKKSPLNSRLITRSFFKWIWQNRAQPGHVLGFLGRIILSPRKSWKMMTERVK